FPRGSRQHHPARYWRSVLGAGDRPGGLCGAQRPLAATGAEIRDDANTGQQGGELMSAPSDTQTHHDQHGRYPEAVTVEDFRQNLVVVQARIDAACHRTGRDPAAVRLLPVSKTKPEASLRMAHAAGCRMLGENKVQEAYRKWEAMQDLT